MNHSQNPMLTSIRGNLLLALVVACSILTGCVANHRPKLAAIPEIPAARPIDSVPLGDLKDSPEVKLDLPIAPGPFEPTWASIEKNYPGTPDWLREAKFGIWVHFGPQAAGESGDWYARKLYVPGTPAYNNHLKKYGPPAEFGYKEVLRDWNPVQLDPAKLTEIYKDAGARFLMIQGVHHDNFDNWNSQYNPWNTMNFGPKRDTMLEWSNALHSLNMKMGIAFHHEYSWWFWQPAFLSDSSGAFAGVPYDAVTSTNGAGKWWQNYDPRFLYTPADLHEYAGIATPTSGYWNPSSGIFVNHLDYANWFATWWALRIMDASERYNPDFIYTDGNSTQPFSGFATGSGYKCDAMQRVIAHYYNRAQ